MAQVKFYAKASMPSASEIDQNGLYFIANGELYKGSQRFGLGRVTKASTSADLDAITEKARGDINIGYQGAKVWDGEAWQNLGGDIDSLQSMWRADIKSWTSGLSTGGSTSYITSITQDSDGKVSANASAFPTLAAGDSDGEIKLGEQSAKVSGWDDLAGAVSGVLSIVDAGNSSISASSATFNEIAASSATFNGNTIEQIADAQISAIAESTVSSTNTGITVGVTTEGGKVTAVSVNASSFGNVMHFRDVVSNTADVSDPVSGDIVVIANADTGFVNGQEYIYTNTNTWELIGDQNTYALNAYSSSAAVLAGALTLPSAIDMLGAAVDALNASVSNLGDAALASVASEIDPSATTLPTCAAVASYVAEALTWIEDPPEPGTEGNPWKIRTVADLQNLKAAVDGTADESVQYKIDDYYQQMNDIDMTGTPWSGIGLMSPTTPKYDPDPDHTFKGVYDGGGYAINNLVIHCQDTDTGKANRYKALFRCAGYGATIKNLTVNVNGIDHHEEEDIMVAAIVGVTDGGLTIENCTANGAFGSLSEPVDNSSGILCRIAVPPAHQDPYTVTLTNVTNNVDIVGICKIGGIISYGYGTMNLNNVVNNGDLTRKGLDATRPDGVGGIIGFGHQDGGHMNYNFNGVKNTGTIVSDLTTYARYTGQIAGKWSVMNATNTGDVVVLNSNDVPAAKACPTTGSDNLVGALPIYLGKLGADGYLHGVSALENGSEYVYMAANISESSGNVVTGPAYTLPNGATITVEHRFGTPNIVSEGGTPITGTLVSGTTYRYTA